MLASPFLLACFDVRFALARFLVDVYFLAFLLVVFHQPLASVSFLANAAVFDDLSTIRRLALLTPVRHALLVTFVFSWLSLLLRVVPECIQPIVLLPILLHSIHSLGGSLLVW